MIGTVHRAGRSTVAVTAVAAALGAAGCALLVARPVLLRATGRPVVTLVLLFTGLLLVGVCWPVAKAGEGRKLSPVPVLVVGVAAFACGRLLGGGEAPSPALASFLVLNTLAAVAEEAFFRRFLYALLAPGGALLAVIGTAVLFALVHVTVYGAWVLPIDLLAGLLLSWQRWASGSWRVPAVTHVLANVMVVV